MTGYVFVESKCDGFQMTPVTSVTPSRALARKTSPERHPVARSAVMSARSSSFTTRPSAARSTEIAGMSTRE
ncbi:MAG: hypothetical protein IPJ56_02425 [Gemmatimonadetes bacterium]|nr:hypothetical protein [Gemmatimonadota bacterium]